MSINNEMIKYFTNIHNYVLKYFFLELKELVLP